MKGKVQNNLMKICLVVNEIYAVFGVMAIGMMAAGKVM
jgi:histidinol dehydrogenase